MVIKCLKWLENGTDFQVCLIKKDCTIEDDHCSIKPGTVFEQFTLPTPASLLVTADNPNGPFCIELINCNNEIVECNISSFCFRWLQNGKPRTDFNTLLHCAGT